MVRVVSRSHVGDTQSEQLLERLRAALKFPPTLRTLNDAGVAVLTIGQTARYGQLFDGRNESVSAFELRIGYIWSDEDPTWHPTTGTIGSVGVSGTVTDSADGVTVVPEFTVTEPA